MVQYAGTLICIVSADVTLTRSEVKVKVRGLLKFRKLHFSRSISSLAIDLLRHLAAAGMTVIPFWGYFYIPSHCRIKIRIVLYPSVEMGDFLVLSFISASTLMKPA